MPVVLLVDGNGLACRLWFANAYDVAMRFRNTIDRIVEQHRVSAVEVAWDTRVKTWRHDLFPEYKAHRPPKPLALIGALDACMLQPKLLHRRAPGYEADDILATLAGLYSEKCTVLILSDDKDMAQLIVPGKVSMIGLAGAVTDDIVAVRRWGVLPSEMRHYLSWTGDGADNLPGVRGVGHKRAIERAHRGEIGNELTYELTALAQVPESRLEAWTA